VNDNDDYDIIPVTPRRNNGKTPGGAGSGIFNSDYCYTQQPLPFIQLTKSNYLLLFYHFLQNLQKN